MTIAERHPLDAALGIDLVHLSWETSGASYRNAVNETDQYEVARGLRREHILRRRSDPGREYNVAYEAGGLRGFCSCHSFVFQTRTSQRPCKHLWIVRLLLNDA